MLSEESRPNCGTPGTHIKDWERPLSKRNKVLSVILMKIAKPSCRWDIKVKFLTAVASLSCLIIFLIN